MRSVATVSPHPIAGAVPQEDVNFEYAVVAAVTLQRFERGSTVQQANAVQDESLTAPTATHSEASVNASTARPQIEGDAATDTTHRVSVVSLDTPKARQAQTKRASSAASGCKHSLSRHFVCQQANHATLDREALYAELAPLVRRLLRQYGQTPELRQDLAGEIYCRYCALLEAYDPERGIPLRPYLIRQLTAATYTYARQQWRAHKREVGWEEESVERMPAATVDPTLGWIEALSTQQMRAGLPQALQQLPARQRQIVIWRYYEERSFEEMAALLGVQPATVRSLLRHGLNKMRALLASIEETA